MDWNDIPEGEIAWDKLPNSMCRAMLVKRAIQAAYEDNEDGAVVDVLTDIRHLCDVLGINFAELDRAAYGYYLRERESVKEMC